MTKLSFIERVLLAGPEGEVSARESHTQQAEATFPKLGFHSHRIGLLNATFSNSDGTGDAAPCTAGTGKNDPRLLRSIQHGLILTTT